MITETLAIDILTKFNILLYDETIRAIRSRSDRYGIADRVTELWIEYQSLDALDLNDLTLTVKQVDEIKLEPSIRLQQIERRKKDILDTIARLLLISHHSASGSYLSY